MKVLPLLLLALALPLPAAAGEAGEANAPAASVATEITPETILENLNLKRAELDLPPFRRDFRLDDAAEDRLGDMIEMRYWSHLAPDGRAPFTWMTARGYRYVRAAENLAAGFDTPALLVDSWMESPGHRDNVIQPEFVDVGIAVLDGSTVRRSSGRSVVVLFGRELIAGPISQRAVSDRPAAPTPQDPR
jgi:uncharacterized protein YkwD